MSEKVSLAELTRKQFDEVIKKAKIKGEGAYRDPPLDLDAIRARAEALDPTDPIKADVFLILKKLAKLSE